MIKLEVDGKEVEIEQGSSLIQVRLCLFLWPQLELITRTGLRESWLDYPSLLLS